MSTGTYGHLQADDRAWFIADSLKWLIEQDRGEPMAGAEGAPVSCLQTLDTSGRTVPAAAWRRGADQREGPRGMLPAASPGDAGLSLGSSVSTALVLAYHAHAALARARREVDAGCDLVLVGIPGVVALPAALKLMRRLTAIADDFNK